MKRSARFFSSRGHLSGEEIVGRTTDRDDPHRCPRDGKRSRGSFGPDALRAWCGRIRRAAVIEGRPGRTGGPRDRFRADGREDQGGTVDPSRDGCEGGNHGVRMGRQATALSCRCTRNFLPSARKAPSTKAAHHWIRPSRGPDPDAGGSGRSPGIGSGRRLAQGASILHGGHGLILPSATRQRLHG